ncbi:hypothetical protein ACRAWD_04520 [Caulobacter segnis]
MIEARGSSGHAKQTFFVSQGGYDTHTNELGAHNSLYADLANASRRLLQRPEGPGPARQRHRLHHVRLWPGVQRQRQRRLRPRLGLQPSRPRRALASSKVHGRYPDMTFGGPEDSSNERPLDPLHRHRRSISAPSPSGTASAKPTCPASSPTGAPGTAAARTSAPVRIDRNRGPFDHLLPRAEARRSWGEVSARSARRAPHLPESGFALSMKERREELNHAQSRNTGSL